jgi:hypothetical protein
LQVSEFARASRWTGITSPRSTTALDLYAGGRAWWQRADAQFQVSGTVNVADLERTGEGTLSAKGNVSWVDPVVGARLRHQFALIRRSRARFSGRKISNCIQSSADFITITCGFSFSVHTPISSRS